MAERDRERQLPFSDPSTKVLILLAHSTKLAADLGLRLALITALQHPRVVRHRPAAQPTALLVMERVPARVLPAAGDDVGSDGHVSGRAHGDRGGRDDHASADIAAVSGG